MSVQLLQCPACGGIYAQIDRSGIPYRHVCPPLSSVELAAAIAAGTVQLSQADAARLAAADAADQTNPPKPGDPTHRSIVLGSIRVERAGHRDENIPGTPPAPPAPAGAAGDVSHVVIP